MITTKMKTYRRYGNPFTVPIAWRNREIYRAMESMIDWINRGDSADDAFQKSCQSYGFHYSRAAIEALKGYYQRHKII